MKFRFVLLIVGYALVACTNGVNKFSDPVLAKIADFQDRRQADSLYGYFKSENANYRKEAVLAFASIQDTGALSRLQEVLRYDKNLIVRKAAAVALGQIRSQQSAVILWKALTEEKNTEVLREVIESCGKTFIRREIHQLVVPTDDPLIDEGMAWAYYRLVLRGEADSTLIPKAIVFLKPDRNLSTRLGAANFFTRAVIGGGVEEKELMGVATNDESPLVRAAVTTALGKIGSDESVLTLKEILKRDSDYRVRISAARSLQDVEFEKVKLSLYEALNDSSLNVAIAVSEIIRDIGTSFEAAAIEALAVKANHWRVKANLYETVLIVLNDKRVGADVVKLYDNTENPYAQAAYLTALGRSTHYWRFINEQLHKTTMPVIKSSAASALYTININNQFNDSLQAPFVQAYMQAIQTGDPAVIGTISDALRDLRLNYKALIKDYGFLFAAKKKLSLPRDNESLQALEGAIAYFEGKKPSPVKNEFNHPIDWDLVKTIPKNQKVLIKTEKGDIVLRLLVEEAPGSVANFVQLVNSKYFDDKNFHRVVPNFVIQGGCNRGDGWGSEDYSIRSEFTERHYTEGSVGMASAGKDTEGTQWFITHSPTPHLDGRYTIFAITESGMDVVHQIEVGDKILSVALLK